MHYLTQHFESIRNRWKEERAAYLESAHVQESEIKKTHGEEYFIFDGVRIWMPDHLQSLRRFEKWLKGL